MYRPPLEIGAETWILQFEPRSVYWTVNVVESVVEAPSHASSVK